MSNVLSVDQLSKAYTEKWLFKSITFGIQKGEKVALVGANGTGKTTLLKTIAGQIEPDSGTFALSKGSSVYYLPQEPKLPLDQSIRQTIYGDDNPIVNTIKAYEEIILDENADADAMQTLLDEMSRLNAWEFEKKASQVLAKLGIPDLDIMNSTLSGGQQKRVALAQMLLMNPDLIIMDEPTNHLDLEAIEWLENLLKAHNITLLMVTHDRYFLDNVSNHILELDQGNLYTHQGNYTYFLDQKVKRQADQALEVSKARNLMKKELEWMRRQPKARGTKSKSRIEAFYDLKDVASQNLKANELEIDVKASRLGNKVIEVQNIGMKYGEQTLINEFTYTFKRGDKIGVIGRNGVGKSTLLDILTQKIEPSSGKIVHGTTLEIGYYTQHTNNLNSDNRIIDEVREIADYVTLGDGSQVSVSKLLDMFLFPPAFQHTPIAKLSGGERRRLQLLKVLVASPNFLILDEPTNDLDIDTLNVLESFLLDFSGCLLIVSHDRYFIDKLVDHLFVFEGEGELKDFHGNYTDYVLKKAASGKKEKKKVEVKPKVEKVKSPEVKLSYKERLELEGLEKEIPQIEDKIKEITERLNTEQDYSKLSSLGEELKLLQTELDHKTERWMQLS
jgi:ATP-binding cassette subfamily F protein uup